MIFQAMPITKIRDRTTKKSLFFRNNTETIQHFPIYTETFHKLHELCSRYRTTKIIPLLQIAMMSAQKFHVFPGFHPFCNHTQAEIVTQRDIDNGTLGNFQHQPPDWQAGRSSTPATFCTKSGFNSCREATLTEISIACPIFARSAAALQATHNTRSPQLFDQPDPFGGRDEILRGQ